MERPMLSLWQKQQEWNDKILIDICYLNKEQLQESKLAGPQCSSQLLRNPLFNTAF